MIRFAGGRSSPATPPFVSALPLKYSTSLAASCGVLPVQRRHTSGSSPTYCISCTNSSTPTKFSCSPPHGSSGKGTRLSQSPSVFPFEELHGAAAKANDRRIHRFQRLDHVGAPQAQHRMLCRSNTLDPAKAFRGLLIRRQRGILDAAFCGEQYFGCAPVRRAVAQRNRAGNHSAAPMQRGPDPTLPSLRRCSLSR